MTTTNSSLGLLNKILSGYYSMGWRGVFYSSLFLLTLVESSSRPQEILLPNLGEQKAVEFSWPIFSASIFVFVALVLSMYLIFEHLASYNQPEVFYHLCILVWIFFTYFRSHIIIVFHVFIDVPLLFNFRSRNFW